MLTETQILCTRFPSLTSALDATMPALEPYRISPIDLHNQARVLEAFSRQQVDSYDLLGSTGYGYNDRGRDKLEAIYCQVFGGEAALVRPHIASGTHALWLALSGNTQPGEEIIAITGEPYATLATVLAQTAPGSFKSLNIEFKTIDLLPGGQFDLDALAKTMSPRTKIIYIQKSRGYSLREPVSNRQIAALAAWLATQAHRPAIVVDNCYGEFVEAEEPGHVGADLTVGSLIKNPGGGLAETGGYIVGKRELVANSAARLLAPGLEGEVGSTGNYLRGMYQGLFLAPHFVGQGVFNARFAAALAEYLGYKATPRWDEERYDLVQAIELGSEEKMAKFCRAIQGASPVDSYVAPVPGEMPGYRVPVVMAAGTFIQGASLELSADGPVEPPYIVYYQGGLSTQHGMLAIAAALESVGAN
ncbi:MAG: methionine gamma-lyase family protein [Bacillota bacterium]|jgi:cystathionine beta-lyase family protein involved in aluminum resistance